MNIIFVGFMGTGKTTVGKLLAGKLRYDFIDTDQRIEERAGSTVAAIFAASGESFFRRLERAVALEVAGLNNTVVATGGGLVMDAQNFQLIRQNGLCIALLATPEAIWERVKADQSRPLLQVADPLQRIRDMLAAREPVYRQANLISDTTGKTPEIILAELLPQIMRRGVIHGRSED